MSLSLRNTKVEILAAYNAALDAELAARRDCEALRLELSIAKAQRPVANAAPKGTLLSTYTRADGVEMGVFKLDWKTKAHRPMSTVQ